MSQLLQLLPKSTLASIEVWALIITNLLADVGPLGIPQPWKGPLAIASAAALAISRGLAKYETPGGTAPAVAPSSRTPTRPTIDEPAPAPPAS